MMNKIMLQLTIDHYRLNGLLTLLDEQMTELEIGNDFDYRLTEDILDYLNNQANITHHSLEEFIFDRIPNNIEIRPIIDKLEDEHSKIATQTHECRSFFIHWKREGELLDCQRASEIGKSYIESQRQHMDLEDREVFPFVIKFLSETDWKAIDDYANAESLNVDPLFGPTVIERYFNIRSDIQKNSNRQPDQCGRNQTSRDGA
jgi:hemerythrin-like domain-containing protein